MEVFIRLPHQKRGSWSSPRTVLRVDRSNGSITVPGSRGRVVKPVLEDFLVAIIDDCFAQIIREANDVLYRCIDFELYDIPNDCHSPPADDTDTTSADVPIVSENYSLTSSTADNSIDIHPFEFWFASDDTEVNAHATCNSENKIDATIDAVATVNNADSDINNSSVGDRI